MENSITSAAVAVTFPILQADKQTSFQTCEQSCTLQQVALFNICFAQAELVSQAVDTQHAAISAWLTTQYSATMPTFVQFRNDRAALKVLSIERGLVDDQYVRKAYNAAVKALYGALPVSDSPEAKAKALARSKQVTALKAGAPKDVPTFKASKEPANVEQLIAKFGAVKVLEACAKLLASDDSTKLAATALTHWAHELPIILKQAAA